MTTEQRLDQLEKRNKRLTVALTLMAVAMCAAVTMAVTGNKHVRFDRVETRSIWVKNDAGKIVVSLSANDGGDGMVYTRSAEGKDLVELTSTVSGNGTVATYQPNGKELVRLGTTVDGGGLVATYQPNGKRLVALGTNDSGGLVYVYNKTGEEIAQMYADEYGNGVVGAWSRKGRGRTLKPGP